MEGKEKLEMKLRNSKIVLCGLLAFFLISFASTATGAERIVLTLEEMIQNALELSSEIKETEIEVEIFKAKKEQADAARFFKFNLNAMVGPSARARGDQIFSPDDALDPVINGVFGMGTLFLIQPLYTFGKISELPP